MFSMSIMGFLYSPCLNGTYPKQQFLITCLLFKVSQNLIFVVLSCGLVVYKQEKSHLISSHPFSNAIAQLLGGIVVLK